MYFIGAHPQNLTSLSRTGRQNPYMDEAMRERPAFHAWLHVKLIISVEVYDLRSRLTAHAGTHRLSHFRTPMRSHSTAHLRPHAGTLVHPHPGTHRHPVKFPDLFRRE